MKNEGYRFLFLLQMSWFSNIFKRKSVTVVPPSGSADAAIQSIASARAVEQAVRSADAIFPYRSTQSGMTLFHTVPEVFFPIDYIASRIAGAAFVVKKEKDDTVVWRNTYMNKILKNPNEFQPFREFVYQHFVQKLATGNSFIRAAVPETFRESSFFQWCNHFWVLPSEKVKIELTRNSHLPVFGIGTKEDVIRSYRLMYLDKSLYEIPVWQVWHDRDGDIRWGATEFLRAESRLEALRKPISNVIAVYEARNIIYVKRGGVGFITNEKQDETGNVALSPSEKKDLLEEYNKTYGLGDGQSPVGFSNFKIGFVRTNLSISDLQPFDETLYDAITIAGAYGIPSVLVPRKDQSTFSNQATAEKSVYSSVVIPMCKAFCQEFGEFIGLLDKGLYLDCDFSHIDCLQDGMSVTEDVKKKINERCQAQFDRGLITLNDWRAQIGESEIEDDELFNKLKLHMDDSELDRLNRIFTNKTTQNEREDDQSSVSDEDV